MQTRCPYPTCMRTFAAEGRHARCPACGNLVNVRPLEIMNEVDRRFERLKSSLTSHCETDVVAPPFAAIVEDVRSLWNVGSIFRSADGAGCRLVYLCGITGTPPRKEIAKTSLGAEDNLHWVYCRSALEALASVRQAGATILGLEYTRAMPGIADSTLLTQRLNELHAPVCMVVGNEVTGVSAEVLSQCDFVCHLPMRGIKESLNVAVAFGIAAYMIADHLRLNALNMPADC